jgi:Ser/Thr protein kinase RdoA (MazF antagonist)
MSGAGAGARVRAHLEAEYGIRVSKISELDQGVFRVGQRDGSAWVARIFPLERPVPAAEGDAEILRFVTGHGFRAERPASPEPVSELDGQAVLITEYVDGVPRGPQRVEVIRRFGGFWTLGVMLGELHTLPGTDAPGAITRPGGAWHHLAEGLPRDEITAAARILDDAGDGLTADDRKAHARPGSTPPSPATSPRSTRSPRNWTAWPA